MNYKWIAIAFAMICSLSSSALMADERWVGVKIPGQFSESGDSFNAINEFFGIENLSFNNERKVEIPPQVSGEYWVSEFFMVLDTDSALPVYEQMSQIVKDGKLRLHQVRPLVKLKLKLNAWNEETTYGRPGSAREAEIEIVEGLDKLKSYLHPARTPNILWSESTYEHFGKLQYNTHSRFNSVYIPMYADLVLGKYGLLESIPGDLDPERDSTASVWKARVGKSFTVYVTWDFNVWPLFEKPELQTESAVLMPVYLMD